jgi:4-hydroxy-3-polyprenylbenzoate decarboxylase
MPYPKDLREFIDQLDKRGKLYTFTEAMDKDSEIIPLLRIGMRGLPDHERQALLFENVTDAKKKHYDMRVACGVYGGSEEITVLGSGSETWQEGLERFHAAIANPLPSKIVETGPVHEIVVTGEDLKTIGLDMIPSPVEDPGFSQMIRTGLPMVTRDPETGITNVGTYNAFFRDRDRAVAAISTSRETMRTHWRKYRERGEEMPLAILVGATPNVMLVGSTAIPYGVDELAVAGAMAGEPMELVRCKTVPLEVPATAELVIEGMVSTTLFEPRFGFAEYPGYLNMERNQRPVMRITAITHRRNAMFTPITVGFTPSDSNCVWNFCNSAILFHRLKYEQNLPIADVYFPQMGGGNDFCLVQLSENAKDSISSAEVLEKCAASFTMAKYMILVDHDIDLRDPDLLIWALTFRVQPHRDVKMIHGRHGGLDPSSTPTGQSRGKRETAGEDTEYYRMSIDATAKFPYPPVALPAKQYMEHALDIWRRHKLPEPKLRKPWHGYSLGFWNEEDQRLADLMVAGDYLAVGRFAKDLQMTAEQVFALEKK